MKSKAGTVVPIRAVMEAFGCTVDWDGAARTVIVRTPRMEN